MRLYRKSTVTCSRHAKLEQLQSTWKVYHCFSLFLFFLLESLTTWFEHGLFSNRSTSNKAPQVCFHTCLTYDETNVDFTVCLKRARCPCNKRSIPSDIQNKNNNNNKKNMVNSTFQAIAPRKRLQNVQCDQIQEPLQNCAASLYYRIS